MACVGISVSTPSHAFAVIPEFEFTEGAGYYSITNNSTDWYIEGLIVTNSNADLSFPPTTTQPFWNAYEQPAADSLPAAFVYFNGPLPFSGFAGVAGIPTDIQPNGGTSSLFFFTALEASQPTFDLVNASGQTAKAIFLDGNFTDITTTPLPSTWTMMLIGFAGLGFFAYRGTKKNAAAVAAA